MPVTGGVRTVVGVDGTHTHRGRPWPAVALFFLAPLVGEYLLGNTPVIDPGALALLAPMYGGGAVLVREVARRAGRGWPAILAFAAAYALLEEGPIDMMLWNPGYGGFDMRAAYAGTFVPALGTSVQLLQDVLSMHGIWSICVPIAVVEAFARPHDRPWLGNRGLSVVGVVFVLGSLLLCAMQIGSTGFVAAPGELAWSLAAIGGLVVLGVRSGGRPGSRRDVAAPRPWAVGFAAFAFTSVYWAREALGEAVAAWGLVAGWCVLVAAGAALCVRWSRARDWGASHRLALAGGALLTYVWAGFLHAQQMGIPPVISVPARLTLATATIVLLVAAARRVTTDAPA